MSSEPFSEDAHQAAANKVLDALQDAITEGLIPGGGRIASYITIVETLDESGNSRVFPLWNDNRTTALLGLLAYGQIVVGSGMEGMPPGIE